MIKASDAIAAGRALIGTPYSELDCINFIKRIIRTAPGGDAKYTTAGTNTLWNSFKMSAKYRDLTWRQEGLAGAKAGMLAFKVSGADVHHVGLITGEGTVIHSSSAKGGQGVVETDLYNNQWELMAIHRLIEPADVSSTNSKESEDDGMSVLYNARVRASPNLRIRESPVSGEVIGHVPDGGTIDVLADGDWPRIRYNDCVGYVSGEYLTRLQDAQNGAVSAGGESNDDSTARDNGACETAQNAAETTTLMNDSGQTIMLFGNWRVAND